MKTPDRRKIPILVTLALLLAASSLAYCAYLHVTLPRRIQERVAEALAKRDQEELDGALRRREKELVQHFYPSFLPMFEDLGWKAPKEPETLEELFKPLIQVIQTIGE